MIVNHGGKTDTQNMCTEAKKTELISLALIALIYSYSFVWRPWLEWKSQWIV